MLQQYNNVVTATDEGFQVYSESTHYRVVISVLYSNRNTQNFVNPGDSFAEILQTKIVELFLSPNERGNPVAPSLEPDGETLASIVS